MFNETAYSIDTDTGLGFLPGPAISAGAGGGPIGIAISVGASLISSLLKKIFGAHKARVQREDQISGAWAASGPQAIQEVLALCKSGQATPQETIAGLQSIEQQFLEMTRPIVKYQGKWGVFPDPNGPRPPKDCNWACGTYWDLHKEIQGLIVDVQRSGCGSSTGKGGGALTGNSALPLLLLIGVAALALG